MSEPLAGTKSCPAHGRAVHRGVIHGNGHAAGVGEGNGEPRRCALVHLGGAGNRSGGEIVVVVPPGRAFGGQAGLPTCAVAIV
ncbi:MAG: hypothetical protein IPL28_01850 [Chloroflexi bacterium]|nr:hypothetical protein [Chloroflexota bacterium]